MSDLVVLNKDQLFADLANLRKQDALLQAEIKDLQGQIDRHILDSFAAEQQLVVLKNKLQACHLPAGWKYVLGNLIDLENAYKAALGVLPPYMQERLVVVQRTGWHAGTYPALQLPRGLLICESRRENLSAKLHYIWLDQHDHQYPLERWRDAIVQYM